MTLDIPAGAMLLVCTDVSSKPPGPPRSASATRDPPERSPAQDAVARIDHAPKSSRVGDQSDDMAVVPSAASRRPARTHAPVREHGASLALAAVMADAAPRSCAVRAADTALRATIAALASLAVVYVVAAGVWLWSLRAGIGGPHVSRGVILVGVAVLLAWLTGVVGAPWGGRESVPPARGRSWPRAGIAAQRVADDPLIILRLGPTVQLIGFVVLVVLA